MVSPPSPHQPSSSLASSSSSSTMPPPSLLLPPPPLSYWSLAARGGQCSALTGSRGSAANQEEDGRCGEGGETIILVLNTSNYLLVSSSCQSGTSERAKTIYLRSLPGSIPDDDTVHSWMLIVLARARPLSIIPLELGRTAS